MVSEMSSSRLERAIQRTHVQIAAQVEAMCEEHLRRTLPWWARWTISRPKWLARLFRVFPSWRPTVEYDYDYREIEMLPDGRLWLGGRARVVGGRRV